MRIDLFAVWFMNGLLGQPAEQSAMLAMSPANPPALADLPRAAAVAGYSLETSSI
jgi:hypothetical protein